MEASKNVLIVIDETETAGKIAGEISAALGKEYWTLVRQAENFAGTDLLPAGIFLLGCGAPSPHSFDYIDRMLQHINLAGRRCAVFSADGKALKYLSGLVKACGAAAGKPLLVKNAAPVPGEIKKWLDGILNQDLPQAV